MAIVLFVIFCVIFVLVYQCFDNRYFYHLLIEHTEEWNRIRSDLNITGLTAYERNKVIGEAYIKYMDELIWRRDVEKTIKYCAFPRAPEAEPIIYKLIDGEWRET